MKNIFITLGLLLLASGAQAADIYKIEKQYAKCATNAMNTVASVSCATDAWAQSDKELNLLWGDLKAMFSGKDAYNVEVWNRLLTAQRIWITYRDANCKLAGAPALGGSLERVLINSCMADTTIQRVKELQNLFAP